MRTISDILKAAGGAGEIEKAIAESDSVGNVKRDAINKWVFNGVRDVYWPILIELADSSPDELFAANKNAREASDED